MYVECMYVCFFAYVCVYKGVFCINVRMHILVYTEHLHVHLRAYTLFAKNEGQ